MKKVKRLTVKGILFLSLIFWPIVLGLVVSYDKNYKEVNGLEACMIAYLITWGVTGLLAGVAIAVDEDEPGFFTVKTIETEDRFITAYKSIIKQLEEKNAFLSEALIEKEDHVRIPSSSS